MFKVSNTAIKKRCKKLGVIIPRYYRAINHPDRIYIPKVKNISQQ